MIYLYAITGRPDAPLSGQTGLERSPLFHVVHGELAAVGSCLAGVEAPATEANLCAHEAVVEALMAGRTVLPFRFGTLLRDRAAVENALSDHYEEFSAGLKRLKGRVEVGLRVLWDQAAPAPQLSADSTLEGAGRTGRAYLLARLHEEQQTDAWRRHAETLAEVIDAPLAGLAAEHTRQVLITPRLLLTAAYLIERERLTVFRERVEALSATRRPLHFLCTGPWPPYNFSTMRLPLAGSEKSANVRI